MELLFEIGTEEVPPLYIRPALKTLEASVGASLTKLGIEFASARTFGTPRRLVLVFEGLAERGKDIKQKVFGPPVAAAFDGSGAPTQAAIGFAKSQQVEVGDLGRGMKGKGEYLCVEKLQVGCSARDQMPSVLAAALGEMAFPKTMKWETEGRRFARPVRWLVLVADGKVMEDAKGGRLAWAGLTAGGTTRGHRFLGSQAIPVTSFKQYTEDLRRNHVIVDHEERKRLVREGVEKAAASVGGRVVEDEDLLERVTFTVEYPLALAGSFSPKFLEMPRDVIVTALKEHQEFFSVGDGVGSLLPHFVAVANMDQDRASKIRLGNERVLEARLADAHFYWEQDLKDGLDVMAARLANVVWQEALGTLAEKAVRLADLALAISRATGLAEPAKLERACLVAKADLTSLMVREKEFASLQGAMGREYARASGEDGEVAEAVFEHYLPRFAGDVLPETATGTVLALADKIDSLVGCFGVGLAPTGSEDPYGLRRQATGFVRILSEKAIHLSMDDLISRSMSLYGKRLTVAPDRLRADVLAFLRQRIATLLVDGGARADLVDSVLEAGMDDPALVTVRLAAVKEFEADPRFGLLVTAFKRAFNITKGEVTGEVNESLFEHQAEGDLHSRYKALVPAFDSLIASRRFGEAMDLLLELAGPIDTFFTSVMVMAEDRQVRQNRLNLLGGITRSFLAIANFARMESSS
jgi:glycyl-tRNA synthetase beta chain